MGEKDFSSAILICVVSADSGSGLWVEDNGCIKTVAIYIYRKN
jgi:hypothetical protein